MDIYILVVNQRQFKCNLKKKMENFNLGIKVDLFNALWTAFCIVVYSIVTECRQSMDALFFWKKKKKIGFW